MLTNLSLTEWLLIAILITIVVKNWFGDIIQMYSSFQCKRDYYWTRIQDNLKYEESVIVTSLEILQENICFGISLLKNGETTLYKYYCINKRKDDAPKWFSELEKAKNIGYIVKIVIDMNGEIVDVIPSNTYPKKVIKYIHELPCTDDSCYVEIVTDSDMQFVIGFAHNYHFEKGQFYSIGYRGIKMESTNAIYYVIMNVEPLSKN